MEAMLPVIPMCASFYIHAAAAAHIQQEDTGMTCDIASADDTQEGENPPEDEDTEQEYFLLSEEDLPQVTPG